MAPTNERLHAAIKSFWTLLKDEFVASGAVFGSQSFLSRFPFAFFAGDVKATGPLAGIRLEILEAAFSEPFRASSLKAIEVFFKDHHGGDSEMYFLDLVGDFINFAMPRTIGLADESEQFDRLYRDFERDLFGDEFEVVS